MKRFTYDKELNLLFYRTIEDGFLFGAMAHEQAFGLLETCPTFNLLNERFSLASSNSQIFIVAALANRCIYQTNQARRLLQQRTQHHWLLSKSERNDFLDRGKEFKRLRDILEHGTEPNSKEKSRPKLHDFEVDNMKVGVGDGSMLITNSGIYLGKVRLEDVVIFLDEFCDMLRGDALSKRAELYKLGEEFSHIQCRRTKQQAISNHLKESFRFTFVREDQLEVIHALESRLSEISHQWYAMGYDDEVDYTSESVVQLFEYEVKIRENLRKLGRSDLADAPNVVTVSEPTFKEIEGYNSRKRAMTAAGEMQVNYVTMLSIVEFTDRRKIQRGDVSLRPRSVYEWIDRNLAQG